MNGSVTENAARHRPIALDLCEFAQLVSHIGCGERRGEVVEEDQHVKADVKPPREVQLVEPWNPCESDEAVVKLPSRCVGGGTA
jgi:hypothetical protein